MKEDCGIMSFIFRSVVLDCGNFVRILFPYTCSDVGKGMKNDTLVMRVAGQLNRVFKRDTLS